ncbi:Helix-turn-helix domain-containing protein [Robiginitalea myxolifaciens]|uniref:Helix-turn-helix domain-containing protein n=1 Tax=Robiginitalea myxolifaciens TaxID=400055 RepID=A0A1I6HE26_9FLAO|nr:helix-turn-helix transcriptional regulator [Robiginitalea myxolifaciens]SFR52547.1 Helix-turn-helix domain-containing protein [Robiginitalea myxolifaciens]
MDTPSALVSVLLFAGALQGIVFGVILLTGKKGNRLANRFLALLLLLLSYRLLVQIMRLFGLGYYDGWYYIMLDLSWVTGALLYFYVRALIQKEFKLRSRDWIHFVPLVIQVACSIFVRLQNLYWDGSRESLSWLGYWGYVVWMNNPTIYIVASILIIGYAQKAKNLLKANLESKNSDQFRWLLRILDVFKWYFVLVLLILIWDLLIFKVATGESYFYFTRFYYYPFFIGLSVLTYWLGLSGFNRRNQKIKSITHSAEEQKLFADLEKKLNAAMREEQLFKDPELSLSRLAEHLGIKSYLLSRCLNEYRSESFTDYVNTFRTQELQRLLQDPEKDKFTLLSLAYEAGFNSKSSFNRAIRKHLGVTPNQLRSN